MNALSSGWLDVLLVPPATQSCMVSFKLAGARADTNATALLFSGPWRFYSRFFFGPFGESWLARISNVKSVN